MRVLIEMSPDSSYSAGDSLTQETSNCAVVNSNEAAAQVLTKAGDILRELHTLLEDYAPTWFTERHNALAEQALHDLNQFISRRQIVPAL
jgi:hypothetical protein